MKKVLIVAAVICASSLGFAASTPNDDIQTQVVALDAEQGRLLIEIAHNTSLANKALDSAQIVEEYVNTRGTAMSSVKDFIGQYPAIADGTFISAVTAASYLTQKFAVMPALTGEASSLLAKWLQRFPKTAKAAPWIVAVAVTYEAVMYTTKLFAMAQLDGLSTQQLTDLYATKLQDYHTYRDNVVVATRELQKVSKELDLLSPQNEMTQISKVP